MSQHDLSKSVMEYFHRSKFADFEDYRAWHFPRLFPTRHTTSLSEHNGNVEKVKNIKQDFHRVQDEWHRSTQRETIREALEQQPKPLRNVRQIICMGLGSFSVPRDKDLVDYERAMIQHAKAMDMAVLAAKHQHHAERKDRDVGIFLQDPRYTDEDRDFLGSLGLVTYRETNAVQQQICTETLFYSHALPFDQMPWPVRHGGVSILVTDYDAADEDLDAHYKRIFRVHEEREPDPKPKTLIAHAVNGTTGYVRQDLRS